MNHYEYESIDFTMIMYLYCVFLYYFQKKNADGLLKNNVLI